MLFNENQFGLISQLPLAVLSYQELEIKNLELKNLRQQGHSQQFFKDKILSDLAHEKLIKAVMVCFSDLEGCFKSLDYDKQFFIKNNENFTFDGSSVKGFASQEQSDLVLQVDWSSFYWLPGRVFGEGKVAIFANVLDRNGQLYPSDFRGILREFTENYQKNNKIHYNIAPEIEGFLLKGIDAEQNFTKQEGFKLVTTGGYYNSLPKDPLRVFIDSVAEAKRAMAFENEKDHPEVAPSQFELNYKYNTPVEACDQIQLYKIICRQVAKQMGYTASFLPKPIADINGSGMHLNISAVKDGVNLFYSDGDADLSDFGMKFSSSILYHAKSLCLILNSSVNSYRRLDPKFEAPNEIKLSTVDRGSMMRIPHGSTKSARVEVRSVAPDCNPYLMVFSLLKIGMIGVESKNSEEFMIVHKKREKLPTNIYDAMRYFKSSDLLKEILSDTVHDRYFNLKEAEANRCPKELGTTVKTEEVIYHHEITNQFIWSRF